MDGVSGMRLLQRALSKTPDEDQPAFWTLRPRRSSRQRQRTNPLTQLPKATDRGGRRHGQRRHDFSASASQRGGQRPFPSQRWEHVERPDHRQQQAPPRPARLVELGRAWSPKVPASRSTTCCSRCPRARLLPPARTRRSAEHPSHRDDARVAAQRRRRRGSHRQRRGRDPREPRDQRGGSREATGERSRSRRDGPRT